MADQEFKHTFNPKERHTPVDVLKMEIENLSEKLDEELEEATEKENYEAASELNKLKKEIEAVSENAKSLTEDDVTDKRYQLEDKKRKLAQAIDKATKDKRVVAAKTEYFEQKERCLKLLDENGNDYERKHFNDIAAMEATFLSSTSPIKIQEKTEELHAITITILWRTPGFLVAMFKELSQKATRMNDQTQAKSLIDAGKFAIESENWDRLSEINSALINLLPKAAQREVTTKIGF
jgi:molecular chaperone DnaK